MNRGTFAWKDLGSRRESDLVAFLRALGRGSWLLVRAAALVAAAWVFISLFFIIFG